MEIDLGRVLDALPAMVWTALPDGRIDFVNRRWSEYSGLSQDEAHDQGWQAAVDPDDLPKLLERWRSILASGEPGEMEARVRRLDEQYRWFLIQCNPMRDDTGRVVKWCGLATDVDESRQAEDLLRRRESESRIIMDNIPNLVSLLTPSGSPELINRQILDYTGRTDEELRKWGTTDLVHPDDLHHAKEVFANGIRSGCPFEIVYRMRRFDGAYRWFEAHHRPLMDEEGRIVRWCVSVNDIDDRKRAEEALRETALASRSIIDGIPGFIAVLAPDGAVETVNPQIVEYCGRPLEELRHWGTNGTVHPDDMPHVAEVFTQSISAGIPYKIEQRLRRFDGEYRWFDNRGVPMRDSSGRLARWYVLLADIDERRRAEDALAASERNLKLTIDTIPTLAWAARPDGSAEFFSQHYLDYVGLSAEEAQDWGWTVTVHPDDMNGLAATWQAILASGKPGEAEARLRRHDGEYRWLLFRANPLRDGEGRIVKWYGVNTDIDDRKRAEEELRRSEAFLSDAQRLSRTGSFLWRIATNELELSAETYRIYELDPAVPATFDLIRTRVHPDNLATLQEVMERVRREGGEFDYDTRLLMPDGSVKHLRVVAHSERNKDGELELRGAVQDVTERRLAEEALNKARSDLAHVTRVTSLGALTASIAHEVNQPLSGIITNASTCLRMLAADPPNIHVAQETARRTIRDGNRAADVIGRLRALFSKRTVQIEPIDLNEAAREVIALSSDDLQRSRVVLRTELADGLGPVGGDRVQLQQVIMNLLRNAADAMSGVDDRPRRVVIRTEPDEDGHVRLSVQDAGVGFGAEGEERLFEAFYTTKSDGMGIGLSVSRSIIESHNGRLWAAPNDGPGVTFSFSIPEYSRDKEPADESCTVQAPVNSSAQSPMVSS